MKQATEETKREAPGGKSASMTSAASKLRFLLESPGFISAPGCVDALTALIAQHAGFPCVYLGGSPTGSHLGIPEPILTMTEQVAVAANITAALEIPLIVDAESGFGGAMNAARTVREFERAGVAGIHLEDAEFPYRNLENTEGLHETSGQPNWRIIPVSEMLQKLDAALDARRNEDFVIIARTESGGAMHGGLEVAIERANIYAERGADMVIAFPDTVEDAHRFAREVAAPKMLFYNGLVAGRRPSAAEAEAMGYKLLAYSGEVRNVIYQAVAAMMQRLKESGRPGVVGQVETMAAVRKLISSVHPSDKYSKI